MKLMIQEIINKFGEDEVIKSFLTEYNRVIVENENMIETLEFYAEEGNYIEHIIGWGPEIPVLKDNGTRARDTLNKYL
jgi:hypothetical protein